MRLAVALILSVFLVVCSSSGAEESAQGCDVVAAQAAEAANEYVSSAGDTLDDYDPFFPGPTPPPVPEALDALPQRFDEADCSGAQAAEALQRHATDVRGNSIGAQAVRAGMLEGDTDLGRLAEVISDAHPPS